MKITPLFLVLIFWAIANAQVDEPDLAFEARLHDIYLNFNSKPMASGEWRSIVGERQSEVYEIQKGDSLWGISKTLFSDGNYWPKIWSLNGSIENPHLITEGNSIRFLMGTESEAPSFTVTDNAQAELEEEEVASTPSHHPAEVEIPPPLIPPKPVLKRLPPSLPQWQEEQTKEGYDIAGFEYVRRPVLDLKSKVKVSAYFEEEEPQGLGVVKEIESFGGSAGSMQYIYVEIPAGQYKKGDRFLVVKNMGPLHQSHDSIDSGSLGLQVQIQGEIELDERGGQVDPKEGRDVYRALITRNINPVEVGGVLVRDPWLLADFSDQGPKSLVVAQIVGGANDKKSHLFGYSNTVFLNRGSKDGLGVGQILPVRSNRQVRNARSILSENARPVGYLKIVKVTPHLATAVIIKSFDDIVAGDLTGAGPLIPSEGVAKMEEKESVLEEMQSDQDEEDELVEDAEESASSEDVMEDEEDSEESSDEDSDFESELE